MWRGTAVKVNTARARRQSALWGPGLPAFIKHSLPKQQSYVPHGCCAQGRLHFLGLVREWEQKKSGRRGEEGLVAWSQEILEEARKGERGFCLLVGFLPSARPGGGEEVLEGLRQSGRGIPAGGVGGGNGKVWSHEA